MKNLKGFIAGVLTTLLVVIVAMTVFAKQEVKTITATYNNIRVTIDGKLTELKDAAGNSVEPFLYNGTNYLPARAISEAVGYDVGWDSDTHTIILTKKSGGNNDNAQNVLGGGKTSFTLEIIYKGGRTETYTIKTDEITVGDALKHKDVKMIPADSSLEGIVDTVNGETADWYNDSAYWAFIINGEYAPYGLFEENVEEGATYTLMYSVWIDYDDYEE